MFLQVKIKNDPLQIYPLKQELEKFVVLLLSALEILSQTIPLFLFIHYSLIEF